MVLPAFDHRTGHFEDVLIHYNSVWLTLKEPLIAVSHRLVDRRTRSTTDLQQLQDLKMFKGGWHNGAICQNLDPDHPGIAEFGATLWGVDWTQGELL